MAKDQWDATHGIYWPTPVSLNLRRYDRVTQIGYDQSLVLWDVWCQCIYPAHRYNAKFFPSPWAFLGRGCPYGKRKDTFRPGDVSNLLLSHSRESRVCVLDVRRTRGFQQMFYQERCIPQSCKSVRLLNPDIQSHARYLCGGTRYYFTRPNKDSREPSSP
ncbi:hypothetical protein CIHG_07728 [Coccidioides immitis H538.4]|uniref:Uncharacterized protein n=1 Tax=Coccidioides immitis H538.4 TaxID=396776 RepID=A0A0J8S114_COCIT|nr:hypothetical protein CIHG_07728 [Coccidioides immitis H538.4]